MYTQVIILGGVYFCVVFRVQQGVPQIIAKYSSEVVADLNEWLADNQYPTEGEILHQREGANLPHGYYIKPHLTEQYYWISEGNQIGQVNPDQFGVPTIAHDGF
jgi:hypothetical protein